MICRACHHPALQRKSAHGLCLGHAFLYLLGPCTSVEEFCLAHATSRRAARQSRNTASEEA